MSNDIYAARMVGLERIHKINCASRGFDIQLLNCVFQDLDENARRILCQANLPFAWICAVFFLHSRRAKVA